MHDVLLLLFPGELGNLLEDQRPALARFDAGRDLFFRAKIASAHPSSLSLKGRDAKGAGQQAGAASHAGFRTVLDPPSVFLGADTAGDAGFNAGRLRTLLASPRPGCAAGNNRGDPLLRFSRWKAAEVFRTQRIQLAGENTGKAHQATFGAEEYFTGHGSSNSRSFLRVGFPVFLSHPRAW
jgi:hypothetical protein